MSNIFQYDNLQEYLDEIAKSCKQTFSAYYRLGCDKDYSRPNCQQIERTLELCSRDTSLISNIKQKK